MGVPGAKGAASLASASAPSFSPRTLCSVPSTGSLEAWRWQPHFADAQRGVDGAPVFQWSQSQSDPGHQKGTVPVMVATLAAAATCS